MKHLIGQNWHSLETAKIVELFESDASDGLAPPSIKHREEFFGQNILKEKKQDSKLKKFFMQFHNALIYILLGASAVTAFLHDWVDSGVIFGVVIINVIIGYIQEVKAQEAIESLKKMMTTEAIVIRDGKKISISSVDLVPGDIVLLEGGDIVSADMRILTAAKLQVDESVLTGESLPVTKKTEPIEPDASIGDRTNMLFKGTSATRGSGEAVVVAIGMETELGKISDLVQTAEDEFQKGTPMYT